jgi:hypothetical protein
MPCTPFDPGRSILAGMSTQQLQAALTAAQQAYAELMTGTKGVSFGYTQGDGMKTVTYSQTNVQQLTAFIQLLQAQLGLVPRARRPIRFNFR